ncbi:MAG: PilN domain-containing protein [Acidimicrobiia bacterium]|nr:MAG: PilN domain-containing protein [Acidimicrobiia bacterium]
MRPINLLPPEVARERSRRRKVALGVVAFLAYLVLLGVGVFYWSGKVSTAAEERDAQLVINRDLERRVAALGESAQIQQDFEARATLVRTALEVDVDWGILLNDLARLIPPRVWVETFNGRVEASTIPGLLGQVSFSGVGFSFPDVSEWLRSLDSTEFAGLTAGWVSTVSQGVIGEEEVVTFSSTAVLTDRAASDRADSLIPEVP